MYHLGEDATAGAPPKPAPSLAQVLIGDTIRMGQAGASVSELKAMLVKAGYTVGTEANDDFFGLQTSAAVKTCQSKLGLTPTGTVDRNFLVAMGMKAVESGPGVSWWTLGGVFFLGWALGRR